MFRQCLTRALTFLLCLTPLTQGITLKIDGNIDLGPKWNYQYEITRSKNGEYKPRNDESRPFTALDREMASKPAFGPKLIDIIIKHDKNRGFIIENTAKNHSNLRDNKYRNSDKTEDKKFNISDHVSDKRVTKYMQKIKYDDMYVEPHKVKDDSKIRDITKHIYEQSLKVFDAIKEKTTDYEMKREVDFLSRSYVDKFGEFVRETQNQQIKTRLGSQKVILNTVDTSNRILERLVNYLIGKMDKKGVLRNNVGSANVFRNELNKGLEMENKHICNKFQICRSQKGFTNFLSDVMTIILSCNDRKVKESADAITEVLKYSDLSHVMDPPTEKRFKNGIDNFEKLDVATLKPILFILKNVIVFKNTPIEVVGAVDSRINKTTALLEVLDTLDKHLPANENNVLVWTDVKSSLKEWGEGKRHDIVEIMQTFIDQVMKAANSLDDSSAKNLNRNINVILGHPYLY